jgi:hypothetical protein
MVDLLLQDAFSLSGIDVALCTNLWIRRKSFIYNVRYLQQPRWSFPVLTWQKDQEWRAVGGGGVFLRAHPCGGLVHETMSEAYCGGGVGRVVLAPQ